MFLPWLKEILKLENVWAYFSICWNSIIIGNLSETTTGTWTRTSQICRWSGQNDSFAFLARAFHFFPFLWRTLKNSNLKYPNLRFLWRTSALKNKFSFSSPKLSAFVGDQCFAIRVVALRRAGSFSRGPGTSEKEKKKHQKASLRL